MATPGPGAYMGACTAWESQLSSGPWEVTYLGYPTHYGFDNELGCEQVAILGTNKNQDAI